MSTTASPQIGFVGLGNMGLLMAINLANYLAENKMPALRVWNRTSSKSDQVVQESRDGEAAVAVGSLKEIANTCDIIFSSLANDAVVKEVVTELLTSVRKGSKTVFVEMSTIYPTLTIELEKQVTDVPDCYFISAPPFGPPPMAKTASLVFAIGGAAEARKGVEQYMVPSMARKSMDFGADPSKAANFKLIGNSVILSTVEMLSESMTLADKTGIGADRVLEWVKDFFPAPSAIGYGTKIVENNFKASGGFTCKGGKKDALHIKNLGDSVGCPMHIIGKAIEHLDASIDANKTGEDKDWSSLVAGQRIESGLEPFGKQS
ncbi:hypothetical protein CBS101457_004428 [Exobasidium rhododendri]|nr:hypothetical protein CBS101457_004428 [Exobasidium rhododendri]